MPLTESQAALQHGYLQEGETERDLYTRLAEHAASLLEEMGACQDIDHMELVDDLYTVLANKWLGPASPVLSNFGTDRGLPVSCYATHVPDSVEGIFQHLREAAHLSKQGGGVGVYLGDIRPTGAPIMDGLGKSSGVLPWARLYDLTAEAVSQGALRRGAFALYLPIDHPDCKQFLRAKQPTGDPRQALLSNVALMVPDQWMADMVQGDQEKRALFVEVMRLRLQTGSPYLVFTDAINRANPPGYKQQGLKVSTSGLCAEVFLHTDPEHTYSCILSSMNVDLWEEWTKWKGLTGLGAVRLAVWFLEAVTEDFIRKADRLPGMDRAVLAARKGRPLGLGVAGLADLFQRRHLPFDSEEARMLNEVVFEYIKTEAVTASRLLGARLGEPEWCRGTGLRHTHLLAVAPTRTNSAILETSLGVEPPTSNSYVAKQAYGSFLRRPKHLDLTEVQWEQVVASGGSLQVVHGVLDNVKECYKTAFEVDQKAIIDLAADRQKFVCQGQSLNLFVPADISTQELVGLHVYAWRKGLKSLYYLRSSSPLKETPAMETLEECKACQG